MGGKLCRPISSSSSSAYYLAGGDNRLARDLQRSQHSRPVRVFVSDEDRRHWVGQPDVDIKAAEFINRVHERHRQNCREALDSAGVTAASASLGQPPSFGGQVSPCV